MTHQLLAACQDPRRRAFTTAVGRGSSGVPALLLCGMAWVGAVRADSAADAVQVTGAADFGAKRAKVAERIAKLNEQAETHGTSGKPAEDSPEIDEELDLLHSLDMVYLQQQASQDQRKELDAQKQRLDESLATLRNFGPDEPRPYSFLLSEDIRDQSSAEADRAEAIETDLAAAHQMLESAREALETCERERRHLHEALGEAQPAERTKLEQDLHRTELESNIAQETVALRRSEIELKTARQELSKTRRTYLEEKAERIAKDVQYTEADYRARLGELTKRAFEFQTRLKQAQKRLHQNEAAQAKTLAELQEQHAGKSEIASAAEAYQLVRQMTYEEITQINQRLGELEQFKHYVGYRYELLNGKAAKENLLEWRDQVKETVDRLKTTERSLALRMEEVQVDQATLYRRWNDADQDSQLKHWIELQRDQLRHFAELSENSLLHLRSRQRSLDRFLDELNRATDGKTGEDRLAQLREHLAACWNYELAAVDDQPITVGKLLTGVVYLFCGLLLARLVSRILARHVLPRFGLNDGAVHALQAILFYSLCVLSCMLTLELIHLPFASFTFLGGAVAIAVGFGSQNILNNFMSGLILLVEQPIRVGDHVETEGTFGTVEHIGARSTRVRTLANHELILPNSRLLEGKVTNLTLSDSLVRNAISVTLSPTLSVPEVTRRLREIAVSHPQVLNSPEPVVLFLGLSKTEQSFELHFWLKLDSLMACRIVESEVRAAINADLSSEGSSAQVGAATAASAPAVAQPVSVRLPAGGERTAGRKAG